MERGRNSEGAKKRKIIHWNPDGDSRQDATPDKKRNRGPLFAFVGVLLLLLSLAAIFGARKYLGLGEENRGPEITDTEGLDPYSDLDYVSRERVLRTRAAVRLEISVIRKTTDDHPKLIESLVMIETAFDEGNRRLASTAYREAMAKFDEVEEMVEEMKDFISMKEKAREAYDGFLSAIENDEELRTHAPYEYEKAVAYGNDGTVRFENGEFAGAVLAFRSALNALVEVEDAANLFIADREIQGKIAFTRGNKAVAKQIFREILELQPDNELAKRNLERARTIDILVPLLAEAKKLEKGGDLEEALNSFVKAFEVDARSARAQQGVTRLKKRIEKNKYENFVSVAKAAEEQEDWDTAIAALEEATEAFPDKEEFSEGLTRVREQGRLANVEDGMSRGLSFERNYEWTQARDAFIEVLDIDTGNEEATKGLLRTGNLIRVLLRYDKLLEQAQELANRGEFQKAIRVFNEGMSIKPSYLALEENSRNLQNMLRKQSKPVSVNFVSDGKTWVSIAGFEMLGKFENRTARIYPGNYRVRGRRKGYRDVVLEVRVRNGRDLGLVKVICYQRS